MENLTLPHVIDLIKDRHGLKSDYQVCKLTDINTPVMSGWRSGKSLPDERMCSKLAEAAGLDPLVLAAAMQAQRSKTAEARSMWTQIAERLQLAGQGAAAAVSAVLFAIALLAMPADEASASEPPTLDSQGIGSLYIVSSNGMVCGEGPDMVNALVANRLSPVPSLTVLCIGLCDRGTMSA